MEINVQWKLRRDSFQTWNLLFLFPTLHRQKRWSQKIGNWNSFFTFSSAIRRVFTHLRKCILVQLGPRVNPNSGDSTLVYEMFSFRRNVHHTPFCSAVLPLILDVAELSTKTAIYDCKVGRKGFRESFESLPAAERQLYRVQEMMAVRRGRVGSFSAKKMLSGGSEWFLCVVCRVVCVVWRKVADSQRSLLGLSRDLSHLQQRTRHFVHFSSVTWPRNFHHCIVSESLCTNFTTNFFTSQCSLHFYSDFPFFHA